MLGGDGASAIENQHKVVVEVELGVGGPESHSFLTLRPDRLRQTDKQELLMSLLVAPVTLSGCEVHWAEHFVAFMWRTLAFREQQFEVVDDVSPLRERAVIKAEHPTGTRNVDSIDVAND